MSTCDVDARTGGGYRLRFGPRPDGDAYSETATFTVFQPVERLVLDVVTSGEDMDESSRCTVLLRPVRGGTRLYLTVEGLSGAEAAEGMRVGWQWCREGIAEQLDAASARASPPDTARAGVSNRSEAHRNHAQHPKDPAIPM